MGARDIVLHIGAPKCGSSSLQSFLSMNPVLHNANRTRKYVYAAIDDRQQVLAGPELQERAEYIASRHICSAPMEIIEDDFTSLLESALETVGDDATPILSSESWANHSRVFKRLGVFEQLDLSVSAVLFVRPQIDWFNSAWWQWGAWTGQSLEDWIQNELNSVDWLKAVTRWKNLPCVKRVELFDMSGGVVSQFKRFLNTTDGPDEVISNQSSSPALLDFLLRTGEFNRTEQDPQVEETINHALKTKEQAASFVLTPDLQQLIVDHSAAGNKELAEHFSSHENAEQFLANSKYFDTRAYSNRPVSSTSDFASQVDYDALISELLNYLLETERSKHIDMDSLKRFDGDRYLRLNPDVQEAGADPYAHFLIHGISEGRPF